VRDSKGAKLPLAYKEEFMYQEKEGKVVITLEQNDYNSLILLLGMGMGYALKEKDYTTSENFIYMANKLNEGNPHWTRYKTGSQDWDSVDLASRRT
jgi:hypothetical protein